MNLHCHAFTDDLQQTMKIRQVASTLLDAPKNRKSSIAQQADQYLRHFIEILGKLDRTGPSNLYPDQPLDDENELRRWSDLQDYQAKLVQHGSVFGIR